MNNEGDGMGKETLVITGASSGINGSNYKPHRQSVIRCALFAASRQDFISQSLGLAT